MPDMYLISVVVLLGLVATAMIWDQHLEFRRWQKDQAAQQQRQQRGEGER